MTDFLKLLGFMSKSYSVGYEAGRRLSGGVVPAYARQAFQRFTPNYWTPLGLLPAKLDKVEMYGEQPTAYYSMVYRNPMTGRTERRSWRYVLRQGEPVEHKAFPVSVR